MRIGIDAFYLTSPLNGIGQVTTHFIDTLLAGPHSANDVYPALTQAFGDGSEIYLYVPASCARGVAPNVRERVLPLKWSGGILARKWWEGRQIPAAARRDHCDLFISLYQSAATLPRHLPHLMLVHDIIYALFPSTVGGWRQNIAVHLTLRGIRSATHLIANSQQTKRDLIANLRIPSDRISVALLAADPRFSESVTESVSKVILEKYGLTPGYLYHGGGFDRRKNLRGILEAYRTLCDRLGNSVPRLVVSGRVSDDERQSPVRQWVQEFGLVDAVTLTGEVPPGDLPALYHGASVFLYPSQYEGFGLPLLEAMHQGVPIVTSYRAAMPEVAGEAAIYCDPSKPDEIAAAVTRILSDPKLRDQLSEAGTRRAKLFTWNSFVENLLSASASLVKTD